MVRTTRFDGSLAQTSSMSREGVAVSTAVYMDAFESSVVSSFNKIHWQDMANKAV